MSLLMEHILSEADVTRLLTDRSAETRVVTAGKIAGEFTNGRLGARERAIAVEIFRIMVQDAELRVRLTLSEQLKYCADLPRDVARTLANDVEQVALPMLEYSTVLTDGDLIEIIASLSRAKQRAIARRALVSTAVSAALVDQGDAEVAAQLVANRGAEIEEHDLLKLVETHGADDAVMHSLIDRSELPLAVAEKLVHRASEEMRRRLVERHNLADWLAEQLARQSREKVTVGMLTPGIDDAEVEGIVDHLRANGRLTPSLLLRALCEGDLRFFEAAMAALAGIPWLNASRLIHDAGPRGLAALCRAAGMPDNLYPAFHAGLQVIRETDFDGADADRERRARRAIERMVTQVELIPEFGSGNLEYFLAKMADLPRSAAACTG